MRRVLPVLLACALLSLAAGCGAEESVRNAVDPVAQAATTTAKAGTVQLAMSGTITADGEQAELSAKGAFDLEADRGSMQVKLSMPGEVPGERNLRFDALTDGLTMYLRSDELTTGVIGDKHWIKVDLEKLGREQGADVGQLEQLASADPTDFLAFLKQARDVHKVGSENLDGTPTTHYKATIDLDDTVRGPSTFPTEVWVDGEGRIRRETIDYSAEQSAPTRMHLTIDYEKFGVPVDVELPDADDTIDFSEVISG